MLTNLNSVSSFKLSRGYYLSSTRSFFKAFNEDIYSKDSGARTWTHIKKALSAAVFWVTGMKWRNQRKQSQPITPWFSLEWKALLSSPTQDICDYFSFLNTVKDQLWVGCVVTHAAFPPVVLNCWDQPFFPFFSSSFFLKLAFSGKKNKQPNSERAACEKYMHLLTDTQHTWCFISW